MCESSVSCRKPNKFWVQIAHASNTLAKPRSGSGPTAVNVQACGVHLHRAVRRITRHLAMDATEVVTVKTKPPTGGYR